MRYPIPKDNTFKNSTGFTLIELLIVIAVVAAMAGFAVVKLTGGQTAARDSRRESDVHQYQNAVEIYANANNGVFPDGNPNVANMTTLCASGQPLAGTKCVDDPKGTNHYQYSTNAANTQYVIWATLEKPNPTQVFYVCSNGFAGTRASSGFAPNNGVCP